MKEYLVKPGSKVDLTARATSDDALFPKESKDTHLDALFTLRERMKVEQHKLYASGKEKLLVVIQAMDTGGKDGTVRHVFSHVDPAGIRVVSFKKPNEEELSHDYLWRIHDKVPASGNIVVFNRSHYEDIVAVNVKKLAPEKVWKKRFRHINEFERMLVDEGTRIVKIFLHISKEEQKERLQKRLDNPDKHWKFNPDDLDDRARWGEFQKAYEEVLTETSTDHAPWYVIPADRKWYRNLVIAKLIGDELEAMDSEYPEVDFDPESIVIDD